VPPLRPGNGRGQAAETARLRLEVAEVRARLREATETIKSIRAEATRNRSLIEGSAAIQLTLDAEGKIADANADAERAFGRSRRELAKTEFASYFTDPEWMRAVQRNILAEGFAKNVAAAIRRPDGQVTHVIGGATAHREPSGALDVLFFCAYDVTALRKSEEALRESEAEFRAVFENARVGIAEIAPDLTVIRINPYYGKMIRKAPSGAVGDQVSQYVYPDDQAQDAADLAELLATGEPYQCVRRLVRGDGTIAWLDVSRVLIRDSEGQPVRIISVGRDITAQRRAEQELRQSEDRLSALVEYAPIGITELSTAGSFVAANAYFCDLLGYQLRELRQLTTHDVTHPDDVAADEAQMKRLISGAINSYAISKRYRHKDGRILCVGISRSVVHDGSGDRVVGIVSVVQDVTAQRQAEESLRRSEASLRALVANAPVGIVDVFPDGSLRGANPAYCQITGYSENELRGLAGLQEIDDPRDYPADQAQLRSLLSGATHFGALKKRYIRKDGQTIWVSTTRALIRNDRGDPERVVSVVSDITEQRREHAEVSALTDELERRVEQRTADLQRANRNLESFTYSVSHDLRAPLRAMSGFSEVLEEDFGDRLGEEGRGYTQRIQAASERMAQLIDDLLLLSRVSRAGINPRPVDLSAEARAIAGQLSTTDPVRQVRFEIENGVAVVADRDLIRTVLQNLLENGWKFTSGTDEAVIEFGAAATSDGQPCYFVRDNGAGFDSAYTDHLFQPFKRLHNERDFPGTGIGLASVARVIERHGGRVWAEGAVGRGATFYFTLAVGLQPVPPGQPGLPGPPPQGAGP
jgi:PAS domain S-box-containing protein